MTTQRRKELTIFSLVIGIIALLCICSAGCAKKPVSHNDTTTHAFAPGIQDEIHIRFDSSIVEKMPISNEKILALRIDALDRRLANLEAWEEGKQMRALKILGIYALCVLLVLCIIFLPKLFKGAAGRFHLVLFLFIGLSANAQKKDTAAMRFDIVIVNPADTKDTIAYKLPDSLPVIKKPVDLLNRYIVAEQNQQRANYILIELLRCFNALGEVADPQRLQAIIKELNK